MQLHFFKSLQRLKAIISSTHQQLKMANSESQFLDSLVMGISNYLAGLDFEFPVIACH